MSDRVLVVGATGFIGRYLCRELASRQFKVLGTYRDPAKRSLVPAVSAWIEIPAIEEFRAWSSILEGITYVVHLASRAHQREEPGGSKSKHDQVNEEGTRHLIEAVAATPCIKRFLYLSTIGVICDASVEVVDEDTVPYPTTAYGISKLAAENLVSKGLKKSNSDWVMVRPTLVYGKGCLGNMARLLGALDSGMPLPIGRIRNRRSFVFIENLVDAVIHCMEHPAASGEVFCLADRETWSTPEFCKAIGQARGYPAKIWPIPISILSFFAWLIDLARFDHADSSLRSSVRRLASSLEVDCSKIERVLGWKQPFSAKDGLRKTLANSD